MIVVETAKGTFAFETYPAEAPKTVAHIVALVKRGFYDGQRVHRALPGFVVQWGDPRSRDLAQEERVGPRGGGIERNADRRRGNVEEAAAHEAVPSAWRIRATPRRPTARSTSRSRDRPDLNGKYTVFGQVIAGEDVPARLQTGDQIVKMYVRR